MNKIAVLGIDGADWKILHEWKSSLPNLWKIINSGVSAKLKSSTPPTSIPAWHSYSTGKDLGSLGVYDILDVNVHERRIDVPSSSSFKSPEIWDYLSRMGWKVGVMNMPGTFPPKSVNGFFISGPFGSDSGFAKPSSMEKSLKAQGYRTFLDELYYAKNKKKVVPQAKSLIKNRFKVAKSLIKKFDPQFFHLTIYHIDTLQHFLWGTRKLQDTWSLLDSEIGNFINFLKASEGWSILILSDHGFEETPYTFHINSWLKSEGYLKTPNQIDNQMFSLLKKAGITQETFYSFGNKIGLVKFIRTLPKALLRRIIKRLPTTREGRQLESFIHSLDLNSSSAVSTGHTIRIWGNEKWKKVKEIANKLKNLRSPSTKPLFRGVYLPEEIYKKGRTKNSPDIVLVGGEGVQVSNSLDKRILVTNKKGWTADHSPYGVFIGAGQLFASGERKTVNIEDVAPTILYGISKLNYKNNFDGRIRKDLLSKKVADG